MKFRIAVLVSFLMVASFSLAGQESLPTESGVPDDLAHEIKSRGILGPDDRRSSRELPGYLETYKRRVGQLITYVKNEPGHTSLTTCTGSLIQANYIVTAAHCAFDAQGKLLKNQFFYPGIQEKKVFYDKYRVARVFLPANYSHKASADTGRDIAIMELERSESGKHAGDRAGWFGYWGKTRFPSGEVTTIGYPGDKERGHQYFQENCNAANNNHRNPDDVRIDCDIYKGQSGSPVLVYSEKYDEYYIHGVIQSESRDINFGSRVSSERAKIFNYIIKGKFGTPEYERSGISERWATLEYDRPDKIHVYVHNDCASKDLYLAYNYRDENGDWRISGFYAIAPKHDVELFNTGNATHYLFASDANGRKFTRGDFTKYLPEQDRKVSLQKYKFSEFGNYTHRFGCD